MNPIRLKFLFSSWVKYILKFKLTFLQILMKISFFVTISLMESTIIPLCPFISFRFNSSSAAKDEDRQKVFSWTFNLKKIYCLPMFELRTQCVWGTCATTTPQKLCIKSSSKTNRSKHAKIASYNVKLMFTKALLQNWVNRKYWVVFSSPKKEKKITLLPSY